ncbi:MAG: Lrp/AsnC family transcriptional regulator [Candidatus Micrarchaeota archaeon]
MAPELDHCDKKIISNIDINARLPVAQIAKKVRLSKETVNYKLKRILEGGYIESFYALINASKFGYRYYRVYMKFQNLNEKTEHQIVAFMKGEKSCVNLRITEGPFDIVFLTMHQNPEELRKFLDDFTDRFGSYLLQKSVNIVIATNKLNLKIFNNEERRKIRMFHGKPIDFFPDDVDLEIINMLSLNAREKLVNMEKRLKKDSRVISYRIKNLEKAGVIEGYAVELDFEKLGRKFLQVDVSLRKLSLLPQVLEFFDRTDTCIYAFEILGKYDISLEIYPENDLHLRQIIEKFKQRFEGEYIDYDVSHIYREYILNPSPFHSVPEV